MAIRRFAAVTILGALLGCQAILGIEEGKPRPEGQGGASASSSSAGMGHSSSGGGGGPALCMLDTDCMDTAADCRAPKCIMGVCGSTNDPLGTPCAVNGGTLCAANGMCVPASCMDGNLDGAETDKDCGGPQCSPCADGLQCKMGSDCEDKVCMGMVCQAPTCSDGVENGQESDVDCGAVCPTKCAVSEGCKANADCATNRCVGTICALQPTVLLLAGGATSTVAGTLHPPSAWSSSTFALPTASGFGLTILSTGEGIGLMRFTKVGDPQDNALMFTTWTNNVFAPFAAVGPAVTTKADPSLASATARAQATYLGTDGKHYYAAFTSPAWSPTADPVGGVAMQSAGNTPSSIAALGDDAEVAFAGSDTNLYVQAHTGGMWQPSFSLGGVVNLPPAIIKLTGSPDFLVAFIQSGSGQVVYSTGSGTTWAPSAPIAGALTGDPVSLAALPGGGAVIAYRGVNSQIYTSMYMPGQLPPWSVPAAVGATSSAPPAVAAGVAGATVELAYVGTNKVLHTRYVNNAWTNAAAVANGTFTHVTITVAP